MIEKNTREIDGMKVQVSPLMALEALRIKSYLIRILSPAATRILGGLNFSGNLLDSDFDGNKVGEAIEKLFIEIGDDGLVTICRKLFRNIIITITNEDGTKRVYELSSFSEGRDADFNNIFKGRLFSIYKIIAFVLEVNYPDFFGLMGDFGEKAKTLFSKKQNKKSTPEQESMEQSEN